MKTIFEYNPTPYEIMLITGFVINKDRYLQMRIENTQIATDLFHLFLIRREKEKARRVLSELSDTRLKPELEQELAQY